MTTKKMVKKVFIPQAIMAIVILAIYVAVRLLGADHVVAVIAATVFIFVSAIYAIIVFDGAIIAFAVAATVAVCSAVAATVTTVAVAVIAFAAIGAVFAAFLSTTNIPTNIPNDESDKKSITKKQKVIVVISYLVEFGIIFSMFRWVLPRMF